MINKVAENPSIEVIPQGMLSSPQIKYCILNKILVVHEEEKPEDLIKNVESAVYKMRLGKTVLSYDEKNKRFRNEYKKGDEIVLAPNSLSYVTVWERFNLPTEIIARFNLKSSLVHKGLLLGTGPIVDPEFRGRICIPMHNFSNFPVILECGKSIINVEFTRTLPTNKENGLYQELQCDKYKYEENKHGCFDLENFLSNLNPLPQSSIHKKFIDFEAEIKEARTLQFWSIAATAIGVLSLLLAAGSMHVSVRESIENSTNRETQYIEMLHEPSKQVYMSLKADYNKLNQEYIIVKTELNMIKEASTNFQTRIINDLTREVEKLKKQLSELEAPTETANVESEE